MTLYFGIKHRLYMKYKQENREICTYYLYIKIAKPEIRQRALESIFSRSKFLEAWSQKYKNFACV